MLRNWKRIGLRSLPYLLIIAFTFVIMGIGVANQSFIGGLDTNFHMNSFYEAARQIATSHYSYFMSLYGFNQSGRVVNALYGPAFNYLGGLLLLITHSWVHFQLWLLFITICVSGFGMNLIARKCHVNYWVSIILAFLYMLSHPIISSWFGNSEFMGLGAAVLPFIMMAGIDIVQRRRIRIFYLTLPMAVILQIHLMTSLIAALALVPFVFTGWLLSRHRIKMMAKGIVAVIIATLLSGNVLGAIYDVYSSNHLIPTFPVFHMQSMANALVIHSDHVDIPAGGFVLAVIVIYAILRWHRMHALDWTLFIDGLGFLWLSSAYFPWDRLWRIWPKISSIVQFPTRFLPVAMLLLTLLFGRIMTKLLTLSDKKLWRFVARWGVSIVMLIILAVDFVPNMNYVKWASSTVWNRSYVVHYSGISKCRHDGPKLRASYRSHDLHRGLSVINKITTDYLPTPQPMTPRQYYSDPTYHNFAKDFIKNPVYFERQVRSHQLQLTWKQPRPQIINNVQRSQKIRVPVVNYGHSVIYLNGRRIYPQKTLVGAVQLRASQGVNHLNISYQPGKVFKVMSTLAVISWLILLIFILIDLTMNKRHSLTTSNRLHKA